MRLQWPFGPLKAIVFSPDGKSVATASFFERGIRLWDVRSGKLLRSFAGHQLGPTRSRFRRTEAHSLPGAATVCFDSGMSPSGWLKTTMDGHAVGLLSVVFLPDGQSLAAAGYGDNDIRIWNVSQVAGDPQAWKLEHSTGPLLALNSPTMSFLPRWLAH